MFDDGWPDDTADFDPEAARERLADRLWERERIDHERTLEALKAVPRHEFVPEQHRRDAYVDRPLPIGEGQTISAPGVVAWMIDLLAPEEGDQILEIGTGCGYHAAVTTEIVGQGNVYSVEYVDSLAEEARERLDRLGYDVTIRVGDGHEGWPEHAPYEGAYLTCAPAEIPGAIVKQVRPGGQIVAPVGEAQQQLVQAEVGEDGIKARESFGGVFFVRMQG